jgi:hypothetical protein
MAKLTYGLKESKLCHIDEVENGLKCNCVCPNCKEKLVAKQGEINEHHFAHDSKECDITIAQETALHIMAKEILAEYKIIKLPKFELYSKTGFLPKKEYREFDKRINKDNVVNYFVGSSIECVQSFDDVYLEKHKKDIVPDLYCEYDNGDSKMLVEISVTNFINENKYIKIKANKIPTIEINLSSYKDKIETLTKRRLGDILIDDLELKKWIYHPQYEHEVDVIADKNREYINKQIETLERYCNMFLPKEYMMNCVLYKDNNHANNFWKKQKISEKISMPWYVGQHIYGDFIFEIDRRIWQAFIVNLIYNSKFPTSANSIWNYMKDKSFLRINNDFIEPRWISNETKFSGLDVVKMYYEFLISSGIISENGLFIKRKGD